MKIAIPVWGDTVSTVLDFSNLLEVVRLESRHVALRERVPFAEPTIIGKASKLKGLGVDLVLCGALSMPMYRMIMASGISVMPFLRGAVDDVLEAYCSNILPDERFKLPGCDRVGWYHGHGGGRRGGRGRGRGRMMKGW